MYQVTNKSLALFSIAFLFSYNIFALNENQLRIEGSSLMVPERLGQISVVHDDEGFHVLQGDQTHTVKKHWVDKKLRNIKRDHLRAFLAKEMGNGYLKIGQSTNGEYSLVGSVRGDGGGPLFGALCYTLTKVACYGTAAAATGAIVVSTGGLAGAVTSVAAASTTLGAGSAVSLTASAIAGFGGTAAAAEATTAVVVVSGGLAGAVATVEAAAVTAYLAGTAFPFLP